MNKSKYYRLTLILILTGLAIWVVAAAFQIGGFRRETWRLGLDLQGGTHLVYEADMSEIEPQLRAEALDLARDIIERRVNAYGIGEPIIQVQGDERISVQLPGFTDVEEARQLIGQTAILDFRRLAEADEGVTTLSDAITPGTTTLSVVDASKFQAGNSCRISLWNSEDIKIASVDTSSNTITLATAVSNSHDPGTDILQWVPATGTVEGEQKQLTGEYFTSDSRVQIDQQSNRPLVSFTMKNDEGIALLAEITGNLINQPLGIFLDNEYISAPTVQNKLEFGTGVITGLTLAEAKRLAIQLNQGALPLPLEERMAHNVDATLGADSLKKSLIAGGIGLGLVLLFMIGYYRLPGLLASFSLIIYVLIILAIFKLLPITLTLAGIAAFILSIGMAVDANVLIFERLKDELRKGRTVGAAIESGFDRAWSSIRDSNLSTILICIILWWFGNTLGTTMVMGFAITLLIGVLVSMFTAIIITRTFLRLFIGSQLAQKLSLFYSGSLTEGKEPDV